MEAVYGRPYAEMLSRLTLDGLKEEIETLDQRDTWLKLDLAGRDPDDGMTAVRPRAATSSRTESSISQAS